MPRTYNRESRVTVNAHMLHASDTIIANNGEFLGVRSVRTKAGVTTITLWDTRSWDLPSVRDVKVRAEHECSCNGTGIFHGRGVVENGVFKGFAGTCFPCGGKGWQSRTDAIRNLTYWNKYARV